MRPLICLFTLVFLLSAAEIEAASPTGWSAVVVPTGPYREKIRSTPISRRPGRLFHVYGNTVRMFRHARDGQSVRPVRQIVIGTPNIREDVVSPR